jgi:Rps23 Pro-64 3,4-dihydroxylase Tpa1-like proline 4-hydroxylase
MASFAPPEEETRRLYAFTGGSDGSLLLELKRPRFKGCSDFALYCSWFRLVRGTAERLEFVSWEGDTRTFRQGVLVTPDAPGQPYYQTAAPAPAPAPAPPAPAPNSHPRVALTSVDPAIAVDATAVEACLAVWPLPQEHTETKEAASAKTRAKDVEENEEKKKAGSSDDDRRGDTSATESAVVDGGGGGGPYPEDFLSALVADLDAAGFAVRDGISRLSGADPVACRAEAEARRGNMSPATISTGTSNVVEVSKRSDVVEFLKFSKDADADALSAESPALAAHAGWVVGLRGALEERLKLGMQSASLMLAEYRPATTTTTTTTTTTATTTTAAAAAAAADDATPAATIAATTTTAKPVGYVKHRDSAPSPYAGRKLTVIYYLNPGWEASRHGGRLRIWPCAKENLFPEEPGADPPPTGLDPVWVEPALDRLVVFRSSLEHEVEAPAAGSALSRVALTAWLTNKRHMALELLAEQLRLKQEKQEEQLRLAREASRAVMAAAKEAAEVTSAEALSAATSSTKSAVRNPDF